MAGVTAKCKISGNGAGGLTEGPSIFLQIQANLYHPDIGRMFPEKNLKICSAVVKLLLLICLRINKLQGILKPLLGKHLLH